MCVRSHFGSRQLCRLKGAVARSALLSPSYAESKKQNPNASGPQIIRPNVSNMSMKGKTNPSQNRKRKVNPNQNHQNQRKQQKVSNYQQQQQQQQRGNWSDYQPAVTTNRGRGINAQSNGYQQNQFHSQNGGPNNGYRSYHTQGGNQRGNFQNNGPYRRQQSEYIKAMESLMISHCD